MIHGWAGESIRSTAANSVRTGVKSKVPMIAGRLLRSSRDVTTNAADAKIPIARPSHPAIGSYDIITLSFTRALRVHDTRETR